MRRTARIAVFAYVAALAPASSSAAGGGPAVAPVIEESPAPAEGEVLTFANRDIVTFRATFHGMTPHQRAAGARQRLDQIPTNVGGEGVAVTPLSLGTETGYLLSVGPHLAFRLVQGDADEGQGLDELSRSAAGRLREALDARRDQRRGVVLVRGALRSLAASALLVLILLGIRFVRRRLTPVFTRLTQSRIAGSHRALAEVEGVVLAIVQKLVAILVWVLALAASEAWLTYVLSCFPLTQPWSSALNRELVGTLSGIGLALFRYLPHLLTAVVIFLLARLLTTLLKRFFERLEEGELAVRGIYPETVRATRRIAVTAVWLVAFAAAYPYLPGSSSEAFKSLSLLVGIVISLGSTGLVAQAMSGLVIIYSRSLYTGDVVRCGETEGVVTEVGLLSTKVATLTGEEVTLPNTVIVGGPVRNFSRLARDKGPLVSTTVSIGYDEPWRQVHDLLLGAARATSGLRRDSEPFVLQRSLGDFFVTYELFARLEDPRTRPTVLSELHGRIQDAFNAAGVQILSPHFVVQPRERVLVPSERRHVPPDGGTGRSGLGEAGGRRP